MINDKLLRNCDKLSFILFCVVMFDASIFGASNIINVGPLSFRQFVLLLLGVSCIPLLISKWKELIKNKYMWLILFFGIWMFVCALRGFSAQNNKVLNDFNAYIYLIFLPLSIVVLNSKEKIHSLMKTITVGSLVLSLIAVLFLIVFLVSKETFYVMVKYGLNVSFSKIGIISESIPRIYMISSLYMIAGCAFSMYFLTMGDVKSKYKVFYSLTTGLCLFALLLSYTRSIYLAAFIAAVIVVLSLLVFGTKEEKKKLLVAVCSGGIICVLFTFPFSMLTGANYFEYAFMRSELSVVDDDELSGSSDIDKELMEYNKLTMQSDELRRLTFKESVEYIKKSPIVGHGLGFTIPSRPNGNEYVYLDLCLGMGVIGLILYLLPIIFIIVDIFNGFKKNGTISQEKVMWFAFLASILAYSYFNPYINSALGIFVYCCTMAIANYDKITKSLKGND